MTMTMFSSQIIASSSIDLCSTDNSTIVSYYAKNLTSQKCGCEICIRKCCKAGYRYLKGSCYRNSSDFMNVKLYTEKDNFNKEVTNIEYFQVGLPDCDGVFRVKNNSFIQTSYNVWVPEFGKFYTPDRYCIDEGRGYTLFVCFSEREMKNVTKGE